MSGFGLAVVATGLVGWLVPWSGPPGIDPAQFQFVVGASVAGLLLLWLIGRRAVGLPWGRLGLPAAPVALHGAAVGTALGAVAAGAALLLAAAVGGARWSGDGGTALGWLGAMAQLLALLVPAALFEELAFRGLPLVLLAGVLGPWRAAVLLSGLFALVHVDNPGIDALALVSIGAAGLFLSACFFAPGGLWTATGAHVGWNAAQAALGASVSGIAFDVPLLDYSPGGPRWLTGGGFGPEGGILGLATLSAAFAVALRWSRPAPDAAPET